MKKDLLHALILNFGTQNPLVWCMVVPNSMVTGTHQYLYCLSYLASCGVRQCTAAPGFPASGSVGKCDGRGLSVASSQRHQQNKMTLRKARPSPLLNRRMLNVWGQLPQAVKANPFVAGRVLLVLLVV
jgi:hypothetical protein